MIPANKQLLSAAIWGFIQLGLLGIGASGFPLWAHHPLPHESLSLPVLLCGQTIFISLLFPAIVPTIPTLAMGLLLMIPMDELAGMLSNTPQPAISRGFACVGVWMIGLGGWNWIARDSKKQLVVSGLGILLTAGGAVLDYLRWEASTTVGRSSDFYPISILPRLCKFTAGESAMPWLQLSLPGLSVLVAVLVLRLQKSLHHPSSTLLHYHE